MSEWLTAELDKQEYVGNEELLKEKTLEIDNLIKKINAYLEVHPKLKEKLFSEEHRDERFSRSAKSYLTLEGEKDIDIIPSVNMTEAQREYDKLQIMQFHAYREACQFVHDSAQNPFSSLDSSLSVRLHNILLMNDPDKHLKIRPRLRNQDDPQIIIGQGYFDPVDGAKVSERFCVMLYKYEDVWKNDNIFIKGAKFVVEYVRIQPHLDGNKRMALMLLNFILNKHGYSDVYFAQNQTTALYDSIKTAMLTRDVTPLACLIAESSRLYCEDIVEKIKEHRLKNSLNTAIIEPVDVPSDINTTDI